MAILNIESIRKVGVLMDEAHRNIAPWKIIYPPWIMEILSYNRVTSSKYFRRPKRRRHCKKAKQCHVVR